MPEEKSQVYIRIDSEGRVLQCEGGVSISNIQDFSKWILIDEGIGVRYEFCQSNYFDPPLYDEDGTCLWKYTENGCVLRSDEELGADWLEQQQKPAPLSEIDRLKKQIQAQNNILDFYEECIAEMASVVYSMLTSATHGRGFGFAVV